MAERKAPGADYPDNTPPTHTVNQIPLSASAPVAFPSNLPSWTLSTGVNTTTFSLSTVPT